MTLDQIRAILAITDPDDFADALGIRINGSRWSKIVDEVGLEYVRSIIADCVEKLTLQASELASLRAEVTRHVEARRTLVEALKRYGRHTNCPLESVRDATALRCTCGFAAALAAAEQETPTR
jgi:hypothetical protein